MFGDFGFTGPSLFFLDATALGTVGGRATVPIGGGLRGTKIAEYNSAVPTDRVYATYHHFHNVAPQVVGLNPLQGLPSAGRRDASIDRWLVGVEKTVLDGWASVEFRLPFYETDHAAVPFNPSFPPGQFATNSGTLGNLSVIFKKMIDYDQCSAWSWGIGVEAPTASDVSVLTSTTRFAFENDVVRLSPFLALTEQLNSRWFVHGFTQLEIPLGGYDVRFDDRLDPVTNGLPSEMDDPVSLMVDVGAGYWIKPPDRCRSQCTLAVLTELHYTVGLTDADPIVMNRINNSGLPTTGLLSPPRPNYLNFTVGLEWASPTGWQARIGSAFPMTRSDRLFDAEPMIQVGRIF